MQPRTVEELAEAVRAAACVRVPETLSLAGLVGVVDYSPADQVVTFRAGTTLDEIDAVLAEHRQCLPLGRDVPPRQPALFDLIGQNMLHTLEAQCGSWRDWVLGMRLVLADGTVVKTGSKVVKSVTGYDLHKLMIGARGTLAVLGEVTLRTLPLSARPRPQIEFGPRSLPDVEFVQRVPPSDWDAFRSAVGASFHLFDHASGTAWVTAEVEWPNGWCIPFCGSPTVTDPVQLRYMRRAKELFDPTGKLNPGAIGVF